MAVIPKAQVLNVISRAYGPEVAASVADRLPDRVDLGDPAHKDLLFRLGLTEDGLISALGGEM